MHKEQVSGRELVKHNHKSDVYQPAAPPPPPPPVSEDADSEGDAAICGPI